MVLGISSGRDRVDEFAGREDGFDGAGVEDGVGKGRVDRVLEGGRVGRGRGEGCETGARGGEREERAPEQETHVQIADANDVVLAAGDGVFERGVGVIGGLEVWREGELPVCEEPVGFEEGFGVEAGEDFKGGAAGSETEVGLDAEDVVVSLVEAG